jgi:50S ribosomal protein L16 3-hydroxylase
VNRPAAEFVAGGIVTLILRMAMIVAVGAMHMLMRDFLFRRHPHVAHVEREAQCHAGQRMIAVEDHLVVRDVGHREDQGFDDLMISFATDGGGVGPHVDSYDVFLLQAQGQRRWRIGAQTDLTLVDGLPLRVLRNFTPDQEYVLEPGDMLYLPPQYAHEGVAIGECMTYSIGFRAPAYQELGEAFLQFMTDTIDLPGRYADPDLKPVAHPAQIDSAMLEKVGEQIRKISFTDDDIAIFIGEYLSEPKAAVVFDPPARPLTAARFALGVAKRGVSLSLKTQMLYRGRHVFINGESFGVEKADRAVLAALADRRRLEPADLTEVSADVAEALHLWYCDGWLALS